MSSIFLIVLCFFLPVLDYCDIVWSPSLVHYFKRFECVHSKFCSLLSATQNFFHCTLVERRRFHIAIMVYRTLHCLSPIYLQDTFNYTPLLLPMLAEIVIVFLCPEFEPIMARMVYIIQIRKFGIHYMYPFTPQPLLDNLSICISLLFKYIITVCYHVYIGHC